MNVKLDGRTALITAASGGLGLATATTMASAGARVAICARDPAKLRLAKAMIDRASGSGASVALPADLTKGEDIENLVSTVIAEFGRLDIAVINTGHVRSGSVEELADSDWYDAFAMIMMSAVRLSRLIVPHMRKQRLGDILFVTTARVREPTELVLSDSFRAALSSLAKTLSHAVGGDNIRVNVIAPGPFHTDQLQLRVDERAQYEGVTADEAMQQMCSHIPLGRIGDVGEFAALATFMVSREAAYLNGAMVVMDGGISRFAF